MYTNTLKIRKKDISKPAEHFPVLSLHVSMHKMLDKIRYRSIDDYRP